MKREERCQGRKDENGERRNEKRDRGTTKCHQECLTVNTFATEIIYLKHLNISVPSTLCTKSSLIARLPALLPGRLPNSLGIIEALSFVVLLRKPEKQEK